jgi:hypothetical protein
MLLFFFSYAGRRDAAFSTQPRGGGRLPPPVVCLPEVRDDRENDEFASLWVRDRWAGWVARRSHGPRHIVPRPGRCRRLRLATAWWDWIEKGKRKKKKKKRWEQDILEKKKKKKKKKNAFYKIS